MRKPQNYLVGHYADTHDYFGARLAGVLGAVIRWIRQLLLMLWEKHRCEQTNKCLLAGVVPGTTATN